MINCCCVQYQQRQIKSSSDKEMYSIGSRNEFFDNNFLVTVRTRSTAVQRWAIATRGRLSQTTPLQAGARCASCHIKRMRYGPRVCERDKKATTEALRKIMGPCDEDGPSAPSWADSLLLPHSHGQTRRRVQGESRRHVIRGAAETLPERGANSRSAGDVATQGARDGESSEAAPTCGDRSEAAGARDAPERSRPGPAHGIASSCARMNGITIKAGIAGVISEDPTIIVKTLLDYWTKVFQSSDKQSDKCVSNVAASMEALRAVRDELESHWDKDAPVAAMAAGPLRCMHVDALRERVVAATSDAAGSRKTGGA